MRFLALIALAWKLVTVAPNDVGFEAIVHAYHAAQAASSELPVEVVLAVAWVESRFDPTATSRVVEGKRVTGAWRSTRPAGAGPRFCGVMQTIAMDDWARCLGQRELDVGYRTGADELRKWLRMTGSLRAALDGHGCGWYGVRNHCNNYSGRVLYVARLLGWRPR